MYSREQIRSKLSRLERRSATSAFTREAAVLMPIFDQNGAPHFLLTRRTEEVETHKGQISFPGGMRYGEEDLETTALRETFEEVGIESARIDILGRFHDYVSSTGYRVSPFAGYIEEPFTVVPQPSEVAEVLHVPLRAFLDPGRLRVKKMSWSGVLSEVYFYTYERHEIWGLTARIIKDFLDEMHDCR